MQELEEIAIIHSLDDYQSALSVKEFLKLNGFSYFTEVTQKLLVTVFVCLPFLNLSVIVILAHPGFFRFRGFYL